MALLLVQLAVLLLIILLASQLLTNALEHFGHRLGFSAGVIGSVFAAVATALPETTVPFIALLAGTADPHVNEKIGVGAILGAPLMLSTLSTGVMTLFAWSRRGLFGWIQPERVGFQRDLHYLIFAFLLITLALYLPLEPFYFRALVAMFLIALYGIYMRQTFKASKKLVEMGHGVVADEPLYFSKLRCKTNLKSISFQLFLGLALLLAGAKGFVQGIASLSSILQISPLLIAILIIPIATELPEKMNSILWINKRKDTLAFGNLTGALVFQGTLLPAMGVLLTSWQPEKEVIAGILTTLVAASWLRLNSTRQGLRIICLLGNGLLYVFYIYLIF